MKQNKSKPEKKGRRSRKGRKIIYIVSFILIFVITGVAAYKKAGVQVAIEQGQSADAASVVNSAIKKVVYAGVLPISESMADKVYQDPSDMEEFDYWKKISVPEIKIPAANTIAIAPSVTVYAEDINESLKGVADEYSPLSDQDFAIKDGVVWVKYMIKNTNSNTYSGPIGRNYKIVVIY